MIKKLVTGEASTIANLRKILKAENITSKYIIKRKHSFKPPLREYVNIINQGYKDCNLDREYLKSRLKNYFIVM